jgi:hypothetical protein
MATNIRGRGEGSKNVAVAGTPEKLSATKKLCGEVVITARPGNAGIVAVGFSNAVRATPAAEIGAIIQAGGGFTLSVPDISQVWIDASVSGEGVSFTYLIPLEVAGG